MERRVRTTTGSINTPPDKDSSRVSAAMRPRASAIARAPVRLKGVVRLRRNRFIQAIPRPAREERPGIGCSERDGEPPGMPLAFVAKASCWPHGSTKAAAEYEWHWVDCHWQITSDQSLQALRLATVFEFGRASSLFRGPALRPGRRPPANPRFQIQQGRRSRHPRKRTAIGSTASAKPPRLV